MAQESHARLSKFVLNFLYQNPNSPEQKKLNQTETANLNQSPVSDKHHQI